MNIGSLLAKLLMDLMASEGSRQRLRRALDSLPAKLDETYDKAMLRIQDEESVKMDCAIKVLSRVLFAQRPVTIKELRCALAVEEDDSYLDDEAIPEAGSLLSVRGGLIVVDDDDIVRFIHCTAKEYFNRAAHSEFGCAQAYLATICITYVSFSAFASEHCSVSLRREREGKLLVKKYYPSCLDGSQ